MHSTNDNEQTRIGHYSIQQIWLLTVLASLKSQRKQKPALIDIFSSATRFRRNEGIQKKFRCLQRIQSEIILGFSVDFVGCYILNVSSFSDLAKPFIYCIATLRSKKLLSGWWLQDIMTTRKFPLRRRHQHVRLIQDGRSGGPFS